MINANNTEIPYILFAFSNNSLSDFSIMNQYNTVIYIAHIIYKAKFASLNNVFVT